MLVEVVRNFVPDGETEERLQGTVLDMPVDKARSLIALGFVRARQDTEPKHRATRYPEEQREQREYEPEPEDDDEGAPV